MTKTLLSLFDYSGQWSAPFADAGWMVVQVDINNLLQGYPTIDGILAAPPCTCFTKSAAQYWPAMDADGRTAESVELVYQVLRCVDYLKPDFWALENPIGRLPKLVPELGKPLLTFDPCDYAVGWPQHRSRSRRRPPSAHAWRRASRSPRQTVVCGRCGGLLSACSPLECDRPGQDFYRKHYDCPPDFTEIYWRAMQDRWQRYYARLRKVGLVDAGGGWMVER